MRESNFKASSNPFAESLTRIIHLADLIFQPVNVSRRQSYKRPSVVNYDAGIVKTAFLTSNWSVEQPT